MQGSIMEWNVNMRWRLKKAISIILALTMLFTLALSNVALASDTSNSRGIDVWDFGGIPASGEIYNNQITPDILDSKSTVKSGAFVTTSFGDLTVANPATSDRLYYYKSDGITQLTAAPLRHLQWIHSSQRTMILIFRISETPLA